MMKIRLTTDEIKTLATNFKTFQKGRHLANQKAVIATCYDDANLVVKAKIQDDEQLHQVNFFLRENGRPVRFTCSCEDSKKFWGFCPHAIALLISNEQKDLLTLPQPDASWEDAAEAAAPKISTNATLAQNPIQSPMQSPMQNLTQDLTQMSVAQAAQVVQTGQQKSNHWIDNLMLEMEHEQTRSWQKQLPQAQYMNYRLCLHWDFSQKSIQAAKTPPQLSIYLGEKTLNRVENIPQFLTAIEEQKPLKLTSRYIWDPVAKPVLPEIQDLCCKLNQLLELDEPSLSSKTSSSARLLKLTPMMLKLILQFCEDHPSLPIYQQFAKEPAQLICMETKPNDFRITVDAIVDPHKANPNHPIIRLQTMARKPFVQLSSKLHLWHQDGRLIWLKDKIKLYEDYLFTSLYKPNEKLISLHELFQFLSLVNVDQHLQQAFEFHSVFKDLVQFYPCHTEIHLDLVKDSIYLCLHFRYGEHRFYPLQLTVHPPMQVDLAEDEYIIRDFILENKILYLFQKVGFQPVSATHPSSCTETRETMPEAVPHFALKGDERIYLFLSDYLPLLQKDEQTKIELYPSPKHWNLFSFNDINTSVCLNVEDNLLEWQFGDFNLEDEDLRALLKAYKANQSFYRMTSGQLLTWNKAQHQSFFQLLELLEEWDIQTDGNKLYIPAYRAFSFLDLLPKNMAENIDQALRERQEKILNPKKPFTDHFLPAHLRHIMRNYQKEGLQWLQQLNAFGLSGILADDMGLGKTIQALAYIVSERNLTISKGEMAHPALVIVPTALLYNWQDEASRFIPDMQTLLVRGNKQQRLATYQNILQADLLILSYPQVRQDIEALKAYHFSTIFLDEAQYIKNHRTNTSQAVKQLQAGQRFALTGTPIENNLSELWSVFDFLMPGYLYSHSHFSKVYEKPISQDQDHLPLKKLKKLIRPFVLRRLKSEVLDELPAKVETVISCPLLPEQEKLYKSMLMAQREHLISWHEELEKNQQRLSSKHTFEILTLLTRLRQICCHPGIFMPDFEGESGKLQVLQELVATAISGGHRLLIFSQFTSLLTEVKKIFKTMDLPYFYLDGTVPAKERKDLVDRFNSGEVDVFLISLKAGGSGLNLTGADTVLLLDPWWNPAVERQATDRAHRLGQTRTVQVYRLITKNTIEEKISLLQAQKQELIDQIVLAGENDLNHLKASDLLSLFEDEWK